VPVINGLSDAQHPCQAMADLLTMQEAFGHLDGLRIAYVGDGNNVAASLAQAAAHFGAEIVLASPPGFTLSEDTLTPIGDLAQRSGGRIEQFHDPVAAVQNADVVYTDTWVSMGQEKEAAQRIPQFTAYQVNRALLAHAKPGAIVMHCLPAHRGQEITDEVADGPQSALFPQAENRLHFQKAILLELMG
jgi:ornithine carbamoyltransferase